MDVAFPNPFSTKNDVLLLLDGSYCAYYCIYGAVNRWKERYYGTSLETIQLPEPGSVPYDELPDLVHDTFYFEKVLMEVSTDRLQRLNDIVLSATGHFYSDAAISTSKVDTIVAMDSHAIGQFRKAAFPEYKAQRQVVRRDKNDYNHGKLIDYMYSHVFPNILPHGRTSYIKLAEAEGDDVVASIVKSERLRGRYRQIILVSSDRDFCQLHRPENRLRQFTLTGDEVVCEIKMTKSGRKQTIPISADQALMMKIIVGDASDNIPGIKKRLGPVGAWRLISEGNCKENLLRLFQQDRDAAVRFQLNRKLIDFNEIPRGIQDRVVELVLERVGE